MNQLKFKLWVEGNAVNFQMLEMPEELRGKGLLFRADNGWEVGSMSYPDICDGFIILHGTNTDKDKRLCTLECPSTPAALRMMANILEALQEFAEKHKLADQPEPEPADDAHTYTLTFTA